MDSLDFIDRLAKMGQFWAEQTVRVAVPLNADEANNRIEYMRRQLVHSVITHIEECDPENGPELADGFATIAVNAFDAQIAELRWAISGGASA